MNSDLDLLCVNMLRFLSIDAVQNAESGHPGLPLDAAPMAYMLWARHLKHSPRNPEWFDRDRFILSAGHGSALLYSLLLASGYELPLEELKRFRRWGSLTPGHPERGRTPGIETTTGPLGQGFGNGVGMAVAEAHLAARYNHPGHEIINHFTFGIVSDGDLMEGVASEAASLAGHLKLGKLIYLYDCNRVSLAAGTDITFTEDVEKRFRAYGWHTRAVDDGNDLAALDRAIRAAKRERERPSLIVVKTHIGFGSPRQDSFKAHGEPLGAENVKLTKRNLGWPEEPDFFATEQALKHFRRRTARGTMEKRWNAALDAYAAAYPEEAAELRRAMKSELPEGWDRGLPEFPADPKGAATRAASGKVLNELAARIPSLAGGDADLAPSTNSSLKGMGDFEHPSRAGGDDQGSAGGGWSYAGRNIHFGVREHAMGAILNGMATHGGIIPFGATFLVFSDYMRPAIRLAALMEIRVIYIFTHDSIGIGQDGPTHQPVGHLASLRAVPGLVVIRPCDANETVFAWKKALEIRDRPVALILTRQKVPVLDRREFAPAEGLEKGAYVLAEASDEKPRLILIATGSEVPLAVSARAELEKRGISTRVVSMPSWELFEAQPPEYREYVLPSSVRARIAVEAASPLGWHRYAGTEGDVIAVDRFGASAPGDEVMRKYGFTVENILERALIIIRKVHSSQFTGHS
ncbi:MAG: transketolase [Syntrophales bacterium]|nr:transketolase [Syntrophales bacterium]MDD5533547.1 transketolase [Syntrophales bacterium]